MSLEAEIARDIHESLQDSARTSKRVRIPVSIRDIQKRWPSASHQQITRAYLIAYELLVLDVAEIVSGPTARPMFPEGDRGEEAS